MLRRRSLATRPHPEAQGEQAPEDAHLSILRQELHPGDVPRQTYAETRRPLRCQATQYDRLDFAGS